MLPRARTVTGTPKSVGVLEWRDTAQRIAEGAHNKGDQKQNEDNLRNYGGKPGERKKPQIGCDQRHEKKRQCPTQHGTTPAKRSREGTQAPPARSAVRPRAALRDG